MFSTWDEIHASPGPENWTVVGAGKKHDKYKTVSGILSSQKNTGEEMGKVGKNIIITGQANIAST